MKLDKIAFAKVVAFVCGRTGYNLAHTEIEELDSLIDIDVPVAEAHYPKNENVERLMMFMAGGTHKIDAIREYRALTGMGLRDSKDAVERYWVSKPVGAPADATLGDILGKINSKERPPVDFDKFEG